MLRILVFSLLLLSPLISQKAFCALDFNVIKHSAQLSAISYAPPDIIDKRVSRLNYALVHHAELAGSASYYLARSASGLQQVITFGQPKVSNVAGANVFASLPLFRVVTPKDIVPLVPPLSPLQLKNIDIYWHLGKEVILLADKDYAITEGFKSMLRATKFVSSVPDESNVQAH